MKHEHIVPSVEKMMVLLGYLGKKRGGATQAELMKAAGLTASTCYRVLQTLRKYDWVRQDEGNLIDLSEGLMPIVMKLSGRTTRLQAAQPILEKLTAQTRLSVKLSIRQGDEQVTFLRTESPRPVSVSGKVGSRFPVLEGSVGAALLADESGKTVEALAGGCLEKIEEKKCPGKVLARIQDIGKRGYCLLLASQNRWKVAAMSMPVRDGDGQVVAAITLLGMDEDFEVRRMAALSAALRLAVAGCEGLISPKEKA